MTFFGLNSPEIFLLLVIILVILGTNRIEKGLILFSRLLKFLLSNQSSFDINEGIVNAKEKELTKDIEETQKKEEETIKNEETVNAKEKELTKDLEETQKKEVETEKILKKANIVKREKKPTKKDPKEIEKEKTVKKLKTKTPNSKVKGNVKKSKNIIAQEEGLDN